MLNCNTLVNRIEVVECMEESSRPPPLDGQMSFGQPSGGGLSLTG